MIVSLKSKCMHCNNVRVLWGPFKLNSSADLDAAETLIDIKGNAKAICPICGALGLVALFDGDRQTEDWMSAGEYEKLNGPNAGDLPPKPKF